MPSFWHRNFLTSLAGKVESNALALGGSGVQIGTLSRLGFGIAVAGGVQ